MADIDVGSRVSFGEIVRQVILRGMNAPEYGYSEKDAHLKVARRLADELELEPQEDGMQLVEHILTVALDVVDEYFVGTNARWPEYREALIQRVIERLTPSTTATSVDISRNRA